MSKKAYNPEEAHPNAADFNSAHVRNIAAGAKVKAEAKSPEPMTEEEAVLLAELARRLRPFDLVSFATSTLMNSPNATQFPS